MNLLKKYWTITFILLFAAIIRFWRIEQLTTFSGDQGFDFLIIKQIIVDHNFTLLGPKIGPYNEIGNLYLGPAYYYLLLPGLWIFKLNPIGAAVTTVIFSLGTILLIYLICKKFFSQSVAIIASSLYSINIILVNQSRSPSNPHLIPFFSALIFYSYINFLNKSNNKIWIVLIGLSLGTIFQLHYLAVTLLFVLIFFLIIKRYFKNVVLLLVFFILAISPQIIFEFKHNFFITKLLIDQLNHGTFSFNYLLNNYYLSLKILSKSFLGIENVIFTILLVILSVILIIKEKKYYNLNSVLVFSIIVNIIFVAIYPSGIQFHYFSTIYPSVVIIISFLIVKIYKLLTNPIAKTIYLLFVVQIFAINLLNFNLNSNTGYTMPEGLNLTGIKMVSKIVSQNVNTDQFNIAATLDGDTRAMPYRYLIDTYGKRPLSVELYPQSQILFLVSRDDSAKIKEYTVWEVASFVPFNIERIWDIQNGIKLYKLVKTI